MPDSDQGTASLFPSLSYDDARTAIEWLCKAFGFRKRLVVLGPDNTVVHSELSLGTGVIMVSSTKPDQGRLSPRSLSGVNQALSARIDDPDEHYTRAKAAGAGIVHELQNEEYGSRGYMAKDLEGHLWYFGTYRPGCVLG